MVYIRKLDLKPKIIHKTDYIKSESGTVTFNDKKESFEFLYSTDEQFLIQVKGHNTFGSDDVLGEALFFVDDFRTSLEKPVEAGGGYVILKSNFVLTPENGKLLADKPFPVPDSSRINPPRETSYLSYLLLKHSWG